MKIGVQGRVLFLVVPMFFAATLWMGLSAMPRAGAALPPPPPPRALMPSAKAQDAFTGFSLAETGTGASSAQRSQESIGPAWDNGGPSIVDKPEEEIGTHGNWVKKKEFLKRAFEELASVEELAAQTQAVRDELNQKYGTIDATLNDFYKSLGLGQGKMQELFSSIDKYLEKKRLASIDDLKGQNLESREFQTKVDELGETIKQYRHDLEQLRLDMQAIEDLDGSLGPRMKKADEQIAKANDQASRARKEAESLWDVLDDKIARRVYFTIRNERLGTVKSIKAYLENDLSSDLDRISATISSHTGKVKEAIASLEQRGLIIQHREQRLEELKQLKLKEEEELRAREAADQPRRARKGAQKGFFARTWDGIVEGVTGLLKAIASPFVAIYNYFFESKPARPARKKHKPAEPATASAEQGAVGSEQPVHTEGMPPAASSLLHAAEKTHENKKEEELQGVENAMALTGI